MTGVRFLDVLFLAVLAWAFGFTLGRHEWVWSVMFGLGAAASVADVWLRANPYALAPREGVIDLRHRAGKGDGR